MNWKFWESRTHSKDLPFASFAEYFLGPEVSASGQFQTDQDIFIDGKFEGQIKTIGLVELAKNSRVKADVVARTAIFEGDYHGKASISDELHITNCASVAGQITTGNLIVDKGALLKTVVKMERN